MSWDLTVEFIMLFSALGLLAIGQLNINNRLERIERRQMQEAVRAWERG